MADNNAPEASGTAVVNLNARVAPTAENLSGYPLFDLHLISVTGLRPLAAWRPRWNSQPVLNHGQEQTCGSQKSSPEQLKAIQELCQ